MYILGNPPGNSWISGIWPMIQGSRENSGICAFSKFKEFLARGWYLLKHIRFLINNTVYLLQSYYRRDIFQNIGAEGFNRIYNTEFTKYC